MGSARKWMIIALAGLLSSPALAANKQRLPDATRVGSKRLVLNGVGTREATVFNIEVYVAALYLEARSKNAAHIIKSKQHKQLIMHFVRQVDEDDIIDAFKKGFEANGDLKFIGPRVKRFNSWMGTVWEGDRLTLTYVPGEGTRVTVRDKEKGTIPGEDFAEALFGIFLGKDPPNESLKTGLLGQS